MATETWIEHPLHPPLVEVHSQLRWLGIRGNERYKQLDTHSSSGMLVTWFSKSENPDLYILIYNMCSFPWYKFSYHGWLQSLLTWCHWKQSWGKMCKIASFQHTTESPPTIQSPASLFWWPSSTGNQRQGCPRMPFLQVNFLGQWTNEGWKRSGKYTQCLNKKDSSTFFSFFFCTYRKKMTTRKLKIYGTDFEGRMQTRKGITWFLF